MNLAKKTLGGIFWAYASYIFTRFGTLLSSIVLARLLVPEDFGLVGFALLVMIFLEAVRGVGINEAVIFISEKQEETADTAFIINVFIGFVLFIVAFLLAPLSINFFDDPRVVDVVRGMSIILFIEGFGLTHEALLQKELEFRRRFVPDFLATLTKITVSIALAMLGFGVWSLVGGNIVGSIARVISRFWVLRWIPRLRFYKDRAQALWNYGIHIVSYKMLDTALEQADQMLIAGFLGVLELGYFTIASRIPEMVIANFSLVLTRVLFPAYTKMKDNLEQLTNSFLMTTKFTALVTMPAGFGMVAVAPELIHIFYGDQWEPAIILLQVLAMLGTVATLFWSAGDVLKAVGRPDISVKLLVVEALYTFPLIFVMTAHYRLAVMASLANLIALCITGILRLLVISHFLKLKPVVFLKIFRTPLLCSVLMFLAVLAWREIVSFLPLIAVFVTSILVGGVVYLPLLWLLEKEDLVKSKDLILSMVRKNRSDDDDEEDEDEAETPATDTTSQPLSLS